MLQYSLLSIIPIVVLNKFVHRFIPEADDTKSNVELLAEIVAQVSLLFVGMFFIHRVITYIPTYSKVCYESLNLVNIVLGFLVIVLSLQTKLGEKVMIITDRVGAMFGGQPAQEQKQPQQQQGGNVKNNATHIYKSASSSTSTQSSRRYGSAESNDASTTTGSAST